MRPRITTTVTVLCTLFGVGGFFLGQMTERAKADAVFVEGQVAMLTGLEAAVRGLTVYQRELRIKLLGDLLEGKDSGYRQAFEDVRREKAKLLGQMRHRIYRVELVDQKTATELKGFVTEESQ